REDGPRRVADAGVEVELVDGPDDCGVPGIPSGRVRSVGHPADLDLGQARAGSQAYVLTPLVLRAKVPGAPQRCELALAGREHARAQLVAQAAERVAQLEEPDQRRVHA